MKKVKLKLNVSMLGMKKGDIIQLETNSDTITDSFWRKRLKDSKKDGCVTLMTDSKKIKKNLKSNKED